jgi:hypothetical protein
VELKEGMMTQRTFTARAYRDTDTWWTIEIPELTSPGPTGTIVATGAAPTWRGVQKAATELAAAWLDMDEADVRVTVEVHAPQAVTDLWQRGAEAEAAARAAVEAAALMRRQAVRALRAEGYTIEAAAVALGISHQRVQQLAHAQSGR